MGAFLHINALINEYYEGGKNLAANWQPLPATPNMFSGMKKGGLGNKYQLRLVIPMIRPDAYSPDRFSHPFSMHDLVYAYEMPHRFAISKKLPLPSIAILEILKLWPQPNFPSF